jgi:hypothetical protein
LSAFDHLIRRDPADEVERVELSNSVA